MEELKLIDWALLSVIFNIIIILFTYHSVVDNLEDKGKIKPGKVTLMFIVMALIPFFLTGVFVSGFVYGFCKVLFFTKKVNKD